MDENSQQTCARVAPFLKWAGGKRWLVDKYDELFIPFSGKFFEPFLGSGAVFFGVSPARSILSDQNAELINCYKQIRNHWSDVELGLRKQHSLHNKDHYYLVRSSEPTDNLERAIRFLYLNRTCWNGLYRVNHKGQFNVPIGTKSNVVLDTDNFEAVSKILKRASLKVSDFEKTINLAGDEDFVFVDPPYTVKHNVNGFIKYNQRLFSWDDQLRLRNAIEGAVSRGAKVLVTNAAHQSIIDLYDGLGEMMTLNRRSVISGLSKGRGSFDELVIKCF